MNPKQIQERLVQGGVSPRECAEFKVVLSGWYSTWAGELETILALKPQVWMEMRKEAKSDKATDMLWDASEMGLKERKLRFDMKRAEKMVSALSSLLRIAENEARQII